MKGTLVFVLRSALGESTNGGVTSKHASLILCGEGIPQKSEPSAAYPGLVLVTRWKGMPNEYVHAEPIEKPEGMVGPMAGGNYVVLSTTVPGPLGGRTVEKIIPVHDRFETPAQYVAMSI
jgi:hypothetical protein